MDDMLVKSRQVAQHLSDLEETFATLKHFRMKPNLAKCSFGVSIRKFLGFIITQHGIEANPKKIQSILELSPLKTIKKVQSLAKKVAALSRFISRSAEWCLPFFMTLH